ncbi:hypothetical protein A1D23_12460 [Chelonobacter oris]|uniref:DUF4431 domain-containing protein n=1 Tax=Chelonobacter oris TaxID=505317 RepID=UPI0024492023|nr:DUF4431 domain-containing protein [Chelonobacter oris]MDH3001330.1 hypothetical protein [Chelonobacter oris]
MKKISTLFIALSVFGFSINAAMAENPSTVNYDTPVPLEGTVKKENGYPMLYLPSPITAVAKPEDVLYSTYSGAKKLQIVWSGKKLPIGCIKANGQLFGAHTAHHKTDVLLELSSYEPCK